MITPKEIKNQEFNRAFRGYNQIEVDKFLDEIITDYEKVYNENVELKDRVLVLTDNLKQYSNLEETLKDTLLVAQKTADEIVKSSREKGDLIVNESELKSKKILDEANYKAEETIKEYEVLRKEAIMFKKRYKAFIESQMITLEEFDIGKDLSVEVSKINKNINHDIDKGDLSIARMFDLDSQNAEDAIDSDEYDDIKMLETLQYNEDENIKANKNLDKMDYK